MDALEQFLDYLSVESGVSCEIVQRVLGAQGTDQGRQLAMSLVSAISELPEFRQETRLMNDMAVELAVKTFQSEA